MSIAPQFTCLITKQTGSNPSYCLISIVYNSVCLYDILFSFLSNFTFISTNLFTDVQLNTGYISTIFLFKKISIFCLDFAFSLGFLYIAFKKFCHSSALVSKLLVG